MYKRFEIIQNNSKYFMKYEMPNKESKIVKKDFILVIYTIYNFRNISGVLLAIQGRRDYLILQMVDGTMTFTVDNGRGPITAIFKPESQFQFCDGNWHEIHGKYFSLNLERLKRLIS